jgi:hypothetical protein
VSSVDFPKRLGRWASGPIHRLSSLSRPADASQISALSVWYHGWYNEPLELRREGTADAESPLPERASE